MDNILLGILCPIIINIVVFIFLAIKEDKKYNS